MGKVTDGRMKREQYLSISNHYDSRLRSYGDSARGADWPNQEGREVRFDVMLGVMGNDQDRPIELLDFACGTGDLLRHLLKKGLRQVRYVGVDISAHALGFARAKFPTTSFKQVDILSACDREVEELATDYCVVNGLFTIKANLTQNEMWSFFTAVFRKLWRVVRKGIAFNLMSKHVDWERSDLFHVSFDQMADFLHQLAGRNIAFRADYGLYEYTCYVFKRPADERTFVPAFRWKESSVEPFSRSETPDTMAVCRPLLPLAEVLLPYLKSVDQTRWYTNWGKLNAELEKGLCLHLGQSEGTCVTASNGTDAITAALIAVAGRATIERPYCLMPSYTFVASAAAALNAGYTPYFVDIETDTFGLSPGRILSHPALARTGAVLVVSPYGRPANASKWKSVSEHCGVPIVIDAAAGFDAFASNEANLVTNIPVVLSFHATKVFGVGEGGAILCADLKLADDCRRALNFGFLGDRVARVTGLNGKMSEYHAAVGLAELESWPSKRAAYLCVADAYQRAATARNLQNRILVERNWASSYALFLANSQEEATRVTRRLSDANIEYRWWYGHGVHRQPAFANFPSDPLPATEDLAPRIIGLPNSVDLSDHSIEKIVDVLSA